MERTLPEGGRRRNPIIFDARGQATKSVPAPPALLEREKSGAASTTIRKRPRSNAPRDSRRSPIQEDANGSHLGAVAVELRGCREGAVECRTLFPLSGIVGNRRRQKLDCLAYRPQRRGA